MGAAPSSDYRLLTVGECRAQHFLWVACADCDDGRRLDFPEVPTTMDALTVRELHFGCHLHCRTCELPVSVTRIYLDDYAYAINLGCFSGWTLWRNRNDGGARTRIGHPEGL